MNKDVKKYFPYFQIFSSTYSVIIYTLLTFVCSAHATFFPFYRKPATEYDRSFKRLPWSPLSSPVTSQLRTTHFFCVKFFHFFKIITQYSTSLNGAPLTNNTYPVRRLCQRYRRPERSLVSDISGPRTLLRNQHPGRARNTQLLLSAIQPFYVEIYIAMLGEIIYLINVLWIDEAYYSCQSSCSVRQSLPKRVVFICSSYQFIKNRCLS